MNVYLEFMSVTEMHFVLITMEDLNVLAKKTTLGMGYHVSVSLLVHNLISLSKGY